MRTNQYLFDVLKSQELGDDTQELKDLQKHRADVEKILRGEFKDSSPTIRYGGSKAKGTLIKDAYDLDVICYFPNDDTSAGECLEDIYTNIRKALEKDYFVIGKNSSLRLQSKDQKVANRDFHIDVVPGRYTDDTKTDCFIHQADAEKSRLKTNLDVHINHVKDSGVVDAIRLVKLWRARKSLPVKQFVWELLIIKLLEDKKADSVAEQLEYVWTEIGDAEEPMTVEDPANPDGNDLSKAFGSGIWQTLSGAASATLKTLETAGWEAVFGTTKRLEGAEKVSVLTQAVSTATVRTKPWSGSFE